MREDDLSQGCLIPLAQATITGALVGLVVLSGALRFGRKGEPYLALTFGSLATLVWWMTSIREWRRSAYPLPIE